MKRPLTRRAFLKAGGASLLVTTSLAGCDLLSTEPAGKDQKQEPGGAGRKGKEAPMLAARVRQGELPPVEERLPAKPLVVEPVDRVGVYGGTWDSGLLGVGDAYRLDYGMGYENLVRWDLAWEEVVPNLARSFESNEDGTEYTFELRKDMKWSDGEPFTADDIVFAYEDVTLNKELSPVPPDNPAKVESDGPYTVRFTFPDPEGLFLPQQATLSYTGIVTKPRHYLEKFHKKYNPDVGKLVEEEGATDWVELFQNKSGAADPALYWQNAEIPTINAWAVTKPLGEGNQVIFERNPYYWKVDPEGSQLPYIDRVVYDLVQDAEVLTVKTLNGEIDMMDRNINTTPNKPTLARNRNRGGYHFFDLVNEKMNTVVISLNLTHKDPVKREIFRNKDFRIGLSHAINRQEIIDVVFVSQGETYQIAPRPGSEFFDEEMAKQYIDHDVDLANEILDRAGYSERDSENFRLGPDGNRISFAVEAAAGGVKVELVDALDLIQGYWREVGVDMQVKTEDLTLLTERKLSNEADASVWDGDGGLDVILLPRYYFPFSSSGSDFAVPWAQWYESEGESGEEPPDAPKRQIELYDRLKATIDKREQARLMREILRIAKEEFYTIGISLPAEGYGVVKNDFHNMPQTTFFAANFPYPAATHPEQYFIG